MKRFNLAKLMHRQSGFTLIEVMVAIVISGILGGGVITAMYQISNVNSIDNARVTAVKQVENAIYYLNRDMQMAQKVEVVANGQIYSLILSWTTWDNNQVIQVTYIFNQQNMQLTRSHSVNGGVAEVSIVGRFITAFSATAPDTQALPPEKAWTILLTASTSSKLKQAAETRQIIIIPL